MTQEHNIASVSGGHGIDALVAWSQTARGGQQLDFIRQQDGPACTSIYGLCE